MPAKFSTISLNFVDAKHVVKKLTGTLYKSDSTIPNKKGSTTYSYSVEMNTEKLTVKVTGNDLKNLSLKQIRIVVNKAIDAICLKSGKHKDIPYIKFATTYKIKGLDEKGIPVGVEGQKQVKALSKAGKLGKHKGRKANDKRKSKTPPRRKRGTQPLPSEKEGAVKEKKSVQVKKEAAKKHKISLKKEQVEKIPIKIQKPVKVQKPAPAHSFVGKKIKIKLS